MANLKHKNQRVAVFIDAQNMYHSARSLFGGRVNFKAVLQTAVGGRQLIRAFSYVIRTKTGEEKAFLEALEKAGIELRVKDLQEFYGVRKKRIGMWDLRWMPFAPRRLWIQLLLPLVMEILFL